MAEEVSLRETYGETLVELGGENPTLWRWMLTSAARL